MNYEDGMEKIVHPENIARHREERSDPGEKSIDCHIDSSQEQKHLLAMTEPKNLDGFMIGRASFGNPWCFLQGNYEPTFAEILQTMETHGKLLWQWKERK